MSRCEFGQCRVEGYYNQRTDLIHAKTERYLKIIEQTKDKDTAQALLNEVGELQKRIDWLDMQIGAQLVCGNCPWR